MVIETIKIVGDGGKGFKIINKSDYDEKIHKPFAEQSKKKKQPKPKPKVPKPNAVAQASPKEALDTASNALTEALASNLDSKKPERLIE